MKQLYFDDKSDLSQTFCVDALWILHEEKFDLDWCMGNGVKFWKVYYDSSKDEISVSMDSASEFLFQTEFGQSKALIGVTFFP